jgi:hypothetical protein
VRQSEPRTRPPFSNNDNASTQPFTDSAEVRRRAGIAPREPQGENELAPEPTPIPQHASEVQVSAFGEMKMVYCYYYRSSCPLPLGARRNSQPAFVIWDGFGAEMLKPHSLNPVLDFIPLNSEPHTSQVDVKAFKDPLFP